MADFFVVHGDITERECDVLMLKYANGLHGVDELIAERVGFFEKVGPGEFSVVQDHNVVAKNILFMGVGLLSSFRYSQIRRFSTEALGLIAHQFSNARVICTPIHGPGYGLDEKEAFFH